VVEGVEEEGAFEEAIPVADCVAFAQPVVAGSFAELLLQWLVEVIHV
jgi:hypothetical protein